MFAPKTVIEGLRGVGRVELVLKPDQAAYVFLGGNAVGKTKTLEALFQAALLSFLANPEVPELRLPGGMFVFETVEGMTDGEAWQWAAPSGSAFLTRSTTDLSGERGLPCVFAGSQNRGFIGSSKFKASPLGTAEQRRTAYIRSTFDGMTKRFTSLNMENGIEEWFVARAQSANRYQKADDSLEMEIDAVLELMNSIDKGVDPDFMEISGDEKVSIRVAGETRQLDQLSSGFSSLLKLVQTIVAGYAALSDEKSLRDLKGVVFIDEIESHLHLSWQARIVRLLVDLFPNTTFFVTTHSALVTAQCRPGEAYRLERDPDEVVRTQLIDAPGTSALADLLNDAFQVDVNKLKLEQMDPALQQKAKEALLQLVREDPPK